MRPAESHLRPRPAAAASPAGHPRGAQGDPATVTRKTVPGTPPKVVSRRWTAPDALKSPILTVLQGAGGELDSEDLFLELEIVMDERLLAGDRETTPEGELRWQYAARRARQLLINEGLMAKGRPGIWELTPAGRRTPSV